METINDQIVDSLSAEEAAEVVRLHDRQAAEAIANPSHPPVKLGDEKLDKFIAEKTKAMENYRLERHRTSEAELPNPNQTLVKDSLKALAGMIETPKAQIEERLPQGSISSHRFLKTELAEIEKAAQANGFYFDKTGDRWAKK